MSMTASGSGVPSAEVTVPRDEQHVAVAPSPRSPRRSSPGALAPRRVVDVQRALDVARRRAGSSPACEIASISTDVRVTSESRMNSSARPDVGQVARAPRSTPASVTRWRSSTSCIAARTSGTTSATRSLPTRAHRFHVASPASRGCTGRDCRGSVVSGISGCMPLGPRVVAELAHRELDGLLDRAARVRRGRCRRAGASCLTTRPLTRTVCTSPRWAWNATCP